MTLQVDVGFGDAVRPVKLDYPMMLPSHEASPKPLAYPMVSVVAEKVHAMVLLEMTNTRMKDFFDVWWLATHHSFDGAALALAVSATFERRDMPIPETTPIALTSMFADDAMKQAQWKRFLVRSQSVGSPTLPETIDVIRAFVMPVLDAVRLDDSLRKTWRPDARVWLEPARA